MERRDENDCPPIVGVYERWITEGGPDPIFPSLVRPKLASDAIARSWTQFTLRGDVDQRMTAHVQFADGAEDSVTVTRASDYQCQDGWLVAPTPYGIIEGEEVVPRDQLSLRPDARDVSIAIGRDGSLVARLETRQESEVSMWCGDGCKGVRLPWKTKRAVVWSRLVVPFDHAASAASEDAASPPLADSARVAQLARRATPPGVRLIAVESSGSGWRLRFQAAREVERQALVDELLSTLWFTDVTEQTVDGDLFPNGEMRVAVFVRFRR